LTKLLQICKKNSIKLDNAIKNQEKLEVAIKDQGAKISEIMSVLEDFDNDIKPKSKKTKGKKSKIKEENFYEVNFTYDLFCSLHFSNH